MAETATGLFRQADVLRVMLSKLAAWQSWTGLSEAGSLEKVAIGGFEGNTISRPFAIIGRGGFGIASYPRTARGTLLVTFEALVPTAYEFEANYANADIYFRNRLGPLLEELMSLSLGGGGYLVINGEMGLTENGVYRIDEDQKNAEGDFYGCEIVVPFGI